MKDKILQKLEGFEKEAQAILAEINVQSLTGYANQQLKEAHYTTFKTAFLSFLKTILGTENLYYQNFKQGVLYYTDYNLTLAIDLIQRIKTDVEDGWVQNLKGTVSAELFTDFLDMAEHLLEEGYKDAAAVIIGSVLEENLRQLSLSSGLPILQTDPKSGKTKPMKAEVINVELCKNNVYNLTYQKAVTGWLDVRNNAAHGHYNAYDLNIVKGFLQAVRDFAAKFI